jgi:hypothetical protein
MPWLSFRLRGRPPRRAGSRNQAVQVSTMLAHRLVGRQEPVKLATSRRMLQIFRSTCKENEMERGSSAVATAHVPGHTERPAGLDRLNIFIGRWITDGHTILADGSPGPRIVASDTYQWVPGQRFVMHPLRLHRRCAGGGLEVIAYDLETGHFKTQFFDSLGHSFSQTLSCLEGVWTWQGEHARCLGTFSEDGKTLVARHERSDDGTIWTPSMTMTIRWVD